MQPLESKKSFTVKFATTWIKLIGFFFFRQNSPKVFYTITPVEYREIQQE